MRENSNERDGEDVDRRPATVTRDARRTIDLQSIVVRYENRADRCTIAPNACADGERTTAWLSADLDAFVELEEAR